MIYDIKRQISERTMRTLVDLVDAQVEALDRLAKQKDRSRASLVREAVDDYLGKHCLESEDEAFGLWSRTATEGLAYQEKARSEWSDRSSTPTS
jgi:predicted transcriptional regulator